MLGCSAASIWSVYTLALTMTAITSHASCKRPSPRPGTVARCHITGQHSLTVAVVGTSCGRSGTCGVFLFPLKHAHTQRTHAKAAPLIFCSAPITARDAPFLTAELLALPDGACVLTRFERCGFCREAEQSLAGPAQHLRNGHSSWHGTDAEKWLLCV
jgi:hypothetical protein